MLQENEPATDLHFFPMFPLRSQRCFETRISLSQTPNQPVLDPESAYIRFSNSLDEVLKQYRSDSNSAYPG